MEVVLFLWIFILQNTCVKVDSVLCFNCVSTETPGCGLNLDLTLLVTLPRIKRQSPNNHSGIEDGRFTSGDKSLVPDHFVTEPNNRNDNRLNRSNSTFNDASLFNATTPNNHRAGHSNSFERPILISSNHGPKSHTFSTSWELHSDSLSEENVFENRGISDDVRKDSSTGVLLTRKVEKTAGSRLLVVECPGSTCLTQRLPMDGGDVFVRTCDVSGVTSGQCHLVNQVLGARLSLVCVCKGDLCNQNGDSGTARDFIKWKILIIRLILMIVLLFF